MNKEKKTISFSSKNHMRIFFGAAMVGANSLEEFVHDAVNYYCDACNKAIRKGRKLPEPSKEGPKVQTTAQVNSFLAELSDLTTKHGMPLDGPFSPTEMGMSDDFVDKDKRFVLTLVHNGHTLAE